MSDHEHTYTMEDDFFDVTITIEIVEAYPQPKVVSVNMSTLRWWDEDADQLGPVVEGATFETITEHPQYSHKTPQEIEAWFGEAALDDLLDVDAEPQYMLWGGHYRP